MIRRIAGLLVFIGIFNVLLTACTEKEFDPNDPAKSYGIAKEPYDDENYEIALTKLGEFKSRFPYSKYATEAELLIANSHYELSQYTEAALAYAQFVKLHPRHPQVDYAMFRIGESYWQDSPEEVDREQEYTLKAIEEWQRAWPSLFISTASKRFIMPALTAASSWLTSTQSSPTCGSTLWNS